MRFKFTSSLVLGLAVTVIGGCSCGGQCRTTLRDKIHNRLAQRQCIQQCDCQTCNYIACPTIRFTDQFESSEPVEQPTPAPAQPPMETPVETQSPPQLETQEGSEIPVTPVAEPEVASEDSQASHLDPALSHSSRMTVQDVPTENPDQLCDSGESTEFDDLDAKDSDETTPAIPASSSSSIYRSREPEVLEQLPSEIDVEDMDPIHDALPAKSFEETPVIEESLPIPAENRVADASAAELEKVDPVFELESPVGAVEPKKHLGPFPLVRLHANLPPAHGERVSPIVKIRMDADGPFIVRGPIQPSVTPVADHERSVQRLQTPTESNPDQAVAPIQGRKSIANETSDEADTIDR